MRVLFLQDNAINESLALNELTVDGARVGERL